MIDRELLLDDTKALVADLVEDLRVRTDEVDEVRSHVRGQYREARDAGRTDRSFEEWREDLLAQVAVGWVLATVFVRFCEDNGLYDTPLLSGPGGRRDLAGDHRADWLAEHPAAGDRDWLREVFERYRAIPATGELFGEHNPFWQFGPSDDGAGQIVGLWRQLDPTTGDLRHDFEDSDLDTRFLGDLYQDLSEHAKKKYALLQTPEFVERFILDRTLEPAIETFGLEQVRMIDPTCGSGHFLLGAFGRILRRWRLREPGAPTRDLVQRALDAVNGVDVNPFAVEVARFRLLVAALEAAQIEELADAPAFNLNVAVGDSLIHGSRSGHLLSGTEGFGDLIEHRYPTEDRDLANRLLQSDRYHAVVGNPPYITVKEPALRDAYRALYETPYMKYSLGVPFTERFFDLSKYPSDGRGGGYVGLITTNAFMKRQFGKRLIEDWLPSRDLTHIIDTSGAYIPGHGTPTAILFGRNQKPQGETIRTVLGIRGEPTTPRNPAEGAVWTSIVQLVDRPGEESEYVGVEDSERKRFAKHPWSLQGGAAPLIKATLEGAAEQLLDDRIDSIGFLAITGEDNLFTDWPRNILSQLRRIPEHQVLNFVTGELVRDWIVATGPEAFFPYVDFDFRITGPGKKLCWPFRRLLQTGLMFGKTRADRGLGWAEYAFLSEERATAEYLITFSEMATHNHFCLVSGANVIKQTAPVIRLSPPASEADYLEVLGYLNSSVACFWMKQVFQGKGQGGVGQESRGEWEEFIAINGTGMKQFPLPGNAPLERARELKQLADHMANSLPSAVLENSPPNTEGLTQARERTTFLQGRMVAVQEELDWECYRLFGLIDEEFTAPKEVTQNLKKGERAFEIVLARRMAAGEIESTWFERHGSTPRTDLPERWPKAYKELVQKRIEKIESDRSIRLLEKPEHKRRWNWESWEKLQTEALRKWLLERLDARELWAEPEVTTTARLADRVRGSEEFLEAVRLYTGRVDADLSEVVRAMVLEEAVPFVVGYRFNASGLRRRREWERTWELQRQEDAIDARTELPEDDPEHLSAAETDRLKKEQGLEQLPVPPKYRKSDYADNTSYRMRGNLDVPQERFILYPGTRKGADTTSVIGWAGWDYLERAKALSGHYASRKDQGAEEPELVALLAGLQELVPWLLQWHNDLDPEYGQRMGEFFASFAQTEARALGWTVEDLKTWTPD